MTAVKGRILGRRACPWCGFEHSHIRQTEGKLPYHYWLHVQDLAPAPMLENLAEFFDTEAPPWMTVIP